MARHIKMKGIAGYYGKKSNSTLKILLRTFNSVILNVVIFLIGITYFSFSGGLTQGIDSPSHAITFLLNESVDSENYSQSRMVFNNLRFSTKVINFSLHNCQPEWRNDFLEGVSWYQNNTIINFRETSEEEAQISVECKEGGQEIGEGDALAEAGPDEIIVHSSYVEIHHAIMHIFEREECSPKVTIHELLHTLGFGHNQNKESIMYPYLNCKSEVESYFNERIKELYAGVE